MAQRISRRDFCRLTGTLAAGTILAGCAQPTQAPAAPQPAAATAPTAAAAPASGATAAPADAAAAFKAKRFPGTKISFWTQSYGDSTVWQRDYLEAMAAEFKKESDVDIEFQIVPWANANQTWLTVAQGGAAPDGADMYWLYSNAAIGGGKYGPMQMDEYRNTLFADLWDRNVEGPMKDGIWQGKFYGPVWRGDIRPMIYRTDLLEAEGLKKGPDTWEEVTAMAKQLTKRDKDGNVTQWGFTFSNALPLQQMLPWLWQAGGEYMTADGKTATIDTPEMRQTLQWMFDLIHTHKVTPPDLMEKSFNADELFQAGKIAIMGQVSNNAGVTLERDFPQLTGKWDMQIPCKGAKTRASYFGAGYLAPLYGTKNPEAVARWIEFLTRDANMQKVIEYTGYVTPNKSVMASPYWTDRPWKKVAGDTMQYAHPSQHPSPAWTTMVANDAGAVIFDLFYNTLVKKNSIEDEIKTAQQRAQGAMDKIKLP